MPSARARHESKIAYSEEEWITCAGIFAQAEIHGIEEWYSADEFWKYRLGSRVSKEYSPSDEVHGSCEWLVCKSQNPRYQGDKRIVDRRESRWFLVDEANQSVEIMVMDDTMQVIEPPRQVDFQEMDEFDRIIEDLMIYMEA